MLSRTIALTISATLAGCTVNYKPPITTYAPTAIPIAKTKTELLATAKRTLVSEGWQITTADADAGVLTTQLRTLRLTPADADCGTTMGIDYLKDNRTTSKVGVNILIDDGHLMVKSIIESEYRPGDVTQDMALTCVSRGTIERKVANAIISAS